MIIIDAAVTFDERHPRIGWHNLVTEDNVTATEEDADHPVTLLANPATYLYWKGETTGEQFVTVAFGSSLTVNYVGIARHNFGTTGAQYIVEYSTNGSTWTPLTDITTAPDDDRVIINEFVDTAATHIRLRIDPGSAIPEIGVLYVGSMLRLQRRIYVGHTPLPFGRVTTVSTGVAEDGQFLGRVLRRRMYESAVSMKNLTAAWYRSDLDPFFEAAAETPFFWSWRPDGFPNECGFAWLTNDPKVSNQRSNGMMEVDFSMQGIL